MKKKELLELLKNVDDDAEIVLSKDCEGNSYSPLGSGWKGAYVPDSTWSGSAYMDATTLDPKDAVDPEDCRTPGHGGAVKALILQPTN